MPHSLVLIALFFSFSSSVHAASNSSPTRVDALESSVATETYDVNLHGKVGSFHFTSPSDGVPRTILYYFPKSIANVRVGATPQKTLVFLHGGGGSTATDAGATSVANLYLSDFTQYAEDHQVILLFPTTSFGWNAHTRFFMPVFLADAKAKLAVDDNRIVLAGHSMGGMGITREGPWMTHLFTGVLGLSAGTQEYMLGEDSLLPYLNGVPYIHINGEKDDFTEFKPRMIAFKAALEKIEAKYKHQSQFELIFRPGGHNYDLPQVLSTLDGLFQKPKVRFPKFFELAFGVVHYQGDPQNAAANPKIDAILDSAFWVSFPNLAALDPGAGKSIGMFLMGDVDGQVIKLNSKSDTLLPKTIKLNLTADLVDLKQDVRVIYNSVEIYKGKPMKPGALVLNLKRKPKKN